jgi:hypothetical protein
VHALYYLGMAAHEDGQPDRARRFLTECITIDPMSRFAEMAYAALGSLDHG